MKNKRWLQKEILQIVILAAPFVLAAVWWHKIPLMVVTRWDVHNEPSVMMPKTLGLLGAPLLNVAICALMAATPWLGPNSAVRTPRQQHLRRTMRFAVTAFVSAVSLMIIAAAAGWQMNVPSLCYYGMMILFAIAGNVIAAIEPII